MADPYDSDPSETHGDSRTMTKLAANLSMMFNEVDFLDRFELAAKAGFKGVEYLFPYDFPAEQIKEKLDDNNLTQVLFDFPAGDWDAGDRGCAAFPDRVGEFQDGVGKAVSSEIIGRLETKLDKILREVSDASSKIDDKNEVEFEIAKSQMDDEYDLRKDNLGKIQADKFKQLEKLIIPLLIKLAKSPEAYIHWPNRAEVIEAQLKKIVAITRA